MHVCRTRSPPDDSFVYVSVCLHGPTSRQAEADKQTEKAHPVDSISLFGMFVVSWLRGEAG